LAANSPIVQLLPCSFEEAEALARRSLVIRERSFGSDDPLTASSLNNLALLLKDANHLEEAETMCRKCIDIRCPLPAGLIMQCIETMCRKCIDIRCP